MNRGHLSFGTYERNAFVGTRCKAKAIALLVFNSFLVRFMLFVVLLFETALENPFLLFVCVFQIL